MSIDGTTAQGTRLLAWTLTDGHAGNTRQASALAHALELAAQAWTLQPEAPWRWLAPRMLPGADGAFGAGFRQALRAPPAWVIGCGRQAALASRLARRNGACALQILDPRIDPRHWDLVIAPEHDGLRGANVISLLGSLHPVDAAWLAQARAAFPDLAALPRPRTVLLIGGHSAHARFGTDAFGELARMLDAALARDGGSVLATVSRRTDPAVAAALRRRFTEAPGLTWCGPDDGQNPYPGLLAWADRIVCSPDSVNMVSEACATDVPVHVFQPQRVGGRPGRFLQQLLARGRIRALEPAMAPFEVQPLRETARVARDVRERLGGRWPFQG